MSFIDNIQTTVAKFKDVFNLIQDVLGVKNTEDVMSIKNYQATSVTTANIIKQSDDTTQVNEKKTIEATRIQVNPNTEYKIPVLYGRAAFSGSITDVCLTSANNELQFCTTLAMATGTQIDTTPSTYEFFNVYLDNQKVNFQSDGQIAASLTDTEGNTNTDYANKIGVYLYANGSANHILPVGFETSGTAIDARNVFETWTPSHAMTGLIFCIVRIAWDPDLELNKVPTIKVDVGNSLTQPGDVLFDYMTNNVYGCGIPESNIKVTSV
jgi:hypothetical protein